MRQTSIDAYHSVDHKTIRQLLLSILNDRPCGLTCDQLETITRRSHQTVSASLHAIRKKGLIEDSGERRPTRSGRQAIVWVTTDDEYSRVF